MLLAVPEHALDALERFKKVRAHFVMENQKPADQNILSAIPSFANGTENTEQFTRLHGWNSYSQTLADTCEG